MDSNYQLNSYSLARKGLRIGIFLGFTGLVLAADSPSASGIDTTPSAAPQVEVIETPPAGSPAAESNEPAVTLDGLVITAAGREQEVKYAPASISVVTHEQLEALPYREVTDALMEIPGVTVVPGSGNSKDISIRGMDAKYTLILVDGKRLSSRESRTSLPRGNDNAGYVSEGNQLPPLETIERIEVIRGPMSSLYGSDAMGGVINVITKRVADRWGGSVRANATVPFSSDGSTILDSNFYVSGPLIAGKLGLQLSGSVARTEESDYIGGSPKREDESLTAKLSWKVSDDHSLIFEVSHYQQETISTPGKSLALSDSLTEREQERMVYAVSHSGNWGWATSESYVQYEDATAKTPSNSGTFDKELGNLTGQTSFIIPLPGRNTVNTGLFYRLQKLTDANQKLNNTASDSTDHTNWALFADDEWRIFDSFALTGGLRMDDDEFYGAHWTPRVYGVYTPTSALTVKAGVSYGFRAPDLRQTIEDWGSSSRGGSIYGNSDLDAETSRTYELGFIYKFPVGVELGVTAYQTNFNDKIMRVPCVGSGAWCETGAPAGSTTYTNVDEAEIRGLEATLDVPLTESLALKFTGTLLDSKIDDTRNNRHGSLNDLPEKQASLSLNWRPRTRPYTAYVRVIYRGKESVPAGDIVTNSGSAAAASPAPDYATVDIGGSWKLNKTFTLYGGVMNLFDKQISYEESSYTIDGARIWAGVKASF
ncbi:TonB-denpendent receptor [Opitutaceae bacterium TAV5]|nr:TonB-denpendent receptor [Opitutaceae bacterium TAV5]